MYLMYTVCISLYKTARRSRGYPNSLPWTGSAVGRAMVIQTRGRGFESHSVRLL